MFSQARKIVRHTSGGSRLKLLAATASYSRPMFAGACASVLQRFARDGRMEIEYRTGGELRRIFLRMDQLRSDLYSVLELGVGDCYRLGNLPGPERIIDGGGNTGMFTLAAHARWPRAKVIVCEPVPDNVAILKEHLRLNGISAAVRPVCLGAAAGSARFYCRAANEGSFSRDLPYHSEINVESRTLSEVYREADCAGRPTLIKLDIEGAEVDVLEEFLLTKRERTTVIGELHEQLRQKPRLLRLLAKHGWRTHFFDESQQCSLFHVCSPDVALVIGGHEPSLK